MKSSNPDVTDVRHSLDATGSSNGIHLLVLLVFFVSGAAALVYEVVWTRSLSLIFGVTTYATATVLAAYMGGLALGSWLFGRRVDRGRNPLLIYAGLELAIGIFGLVLPLLLDAIRPAYVYLRAAELPYPLFPLARALLAGAVLMIPTTMMGGTFPVLVRFFVTSRAQIGGATGLLYSLNTAGAVAGTLIAGFYLIAELGLQASTWCAVAANIGCAVAALVLARRVSWAAPAQAEEAGSAAANASDRIVTLVLVAIGISGFAALAYEVLWTRALLRYLHNSVYAFTTMLTTFLIGIAIGSALYTAFLQRVRRQMLLFAVLELFVGIGFLGSARLFEYLPAILEAIRGTESVGSFGGSLVLMIGMSALILLLPSILLGATLPLATRLYATRLTTLGAAVGRIYAVNTLGSILGSLGTGFVLVPFFGMQGTLVFLVGLNVVLATALATADETLAPRRSFLVGAGVTVLLLVVLALPSDLFRRTFAIGGHPLVFYQEGVTDSVGVVEIAGQRVIQYEDQRGTAGTMSYPWNFFLGHVPVLLHPGEPRTALHICFGVGNSLSALASHASLERVDNVELSPHILDAADYFWTNNGVIHEPKVNTIIEDGRNHLMTTREVYDVIAMEPPLIFTAGVIYLYTREFYEDAARHLADDGVLLQWLPVGEASLDDERMIFRALYDVFPHATAWRHYPGGPLLLIGTKHPLQIDYVRLRERMQEDRVRQDLSLIGIGSADELLSHFIFDEKAFAEFASSVPPVTDDKTVVDFRSPYHLGSGFGLGAYSTIARADGINAMSAGEVRARYYFDRRRPVAPYLTNLGGMPREFVARRIAKLAKFRQHVPPPIAEEDWQRW